VHELKIKYKSMGSLNNSELCSFRKVASSWGVGCREVRSVFLSIAWMFPKWFFLAEVEIAVAPVAVSVHVNYLSTF